MDNMLEDLVGMWFGFMDANRKALDLTEDVEDRYQSAMYCESLMTSRYKLIEQIDMYFEGKFSNV